jgi:hypothetical protein
MSNEKKTIFWSEEPQFDKSVSETDAYVLKRVAQAMLRSLFPSTLKWGVVHHSNYYLIGCDIPKDVKVTNDHFQQTIQVYPKRIPRVWVQWEKDGLKMVCKLWKNIEQEKSRKRPRLEN